MVSENPHMAWFFADDLGSRSWFGGFNWGNWGSANQQAYRAGAIALAQTFHDVAAEHGLMVMVNGTWNAGALSSNGGGYPDANTPGLSLADGGYIEHHATLSFPTGPHTRRGSGAPLPARSARATRSCTCRPVMWPPGTLTTRPGVLLFLSAQADYDTADVWGSFHPTGLPSKVG